MYGSNITTHNSKKEDKEHNEKTENILYQHTPIVKIDHLTKAYDFHKAVDDVTFEIFKGEIFGLLGHNGAGKTTLINMLAGLAAPTEGTAFISGYNICTQPIKARKKIGLLPDNPGNYLHMTARQNLEFYAELVNISQKKSSMLIPHLLELTELIEWQDVKVSKFSRGMKQRLGLAQCLIRDPDVLLLDEATLGIDPEGTIKIRKLMIELANQGKTILVSSHLLSEISKMCNRIAIMRWGKIVALGSIQELRAKLGLSDQIELEELYLSLNE